MLEFRVVQSSEPRILLKHENGKEVRNVSNRNVKAMNESRERKMKPDVQIRVAFEVQI